MNRFALGLVVTLASAATLALLAACSSSPGGSGSGGALSCQPISGTYVVEWTADANNSPICPGPSVLPGTEMYPQDSGADCSCNGSTETCTGASQNADGESFTDTLTIDFTASGATGSVVIVFGDAASCAYSFTATE